jgi:formate dehydrogenase iron-sulfur subunit
VSVQSSPPSAGESVGDFLAELLAEQGRLDTPVARFASAHDAGSPLAALSSQLIPLSAPGPGEQYAFEVELDSCTGCKSCVAACHSLNGLDENETWRDVGLISSPDPLHPFTQTITTACHHCVDPACLNGCPVLAYEKDALTGIVRHLDDQCIGCSYCVLMCPYDVPKYNAARGIVRKCDLCHGRLSEGEAPACVQACPTHAIRIVNVVTHVNGQARPDTSAFLAMAPDPRLTFPTTRYVSKKAIPETLVAADARAVIAQPPHMPLVAMLILMPMAIGCGIADKLLLPPTAELGVFGWMAGVAGLLLSVLHLGQPRRAWRIFLGLRKSWLSREAMLFGAWLPLSTAYLAVRLGWVALPAGPWRSLLAFGTAGLGLAGLFCSVMIYVATRREFWSFTRTAPRFFGTAILLGLAGALATPSAPPALGFALAAATLLKLGLEALALIPLLSPASPTAAFSAERKSALLLVGKLRVGASMRVVSAMIGGVILPALIANGALPAKVAPVAFALVLVGELAERRLFFQAVVAPKMPGINHA